MKTKTNLRTPITLLVAIFLLIICIAFSGCTSTQDSVNAHTKVVEFDGCEYIVYGSGGTQEWGSHKGNCKYCADR